MDFDLSEDQRAFQDTARQFAADVLLPNAAAGAGGATVTSTCPHCGVSDVSSAAAMDAHLRRRCRCVSCQHAAEGKGGVYGVLAACARHRRRQACDPVAG